MAKKPTKKKKKPWISKRTIWYKHFTDFSNPVTFLNKTESAKAAGYKCRSYMSFANVGYQNFKKLETQIEQWLDDNGLSMLALKMKHVELLECQKTVFQKVKGNVNGIDLPAHIRIAAESHKMSVAGKGEAAIEVDEGDTLLAINVADPEIQRRALDMAYKVKGTYAPVKHKKEHSGPEGGPIPWTNFPPEPATIEEWEEWNREAEKQETTAAETV